MYGVFQTNKQRRLIAKSLSEIEQQFADRKFRDKKQPMPLGYTVNEKEFKLVDPMISMIFLILVKKDKYSEFENGPYCFI